jgi:pimeloyl-ACP methyl ester carboxylesterase
MYQESSAISAPVIRCSSVGTARCVLGCELAGSDAFYETLWQRRHALQAIPSTLVWEERDPAFGPRYLERWQRVLPEAQVVRLADVGHFPQEEAPEQLLAAIRARL